MKQKSGKMKDIFPLFFKHPRYCGFILFILVIGAFYVAEWVVRMCYMVHTSGLLCVQQVSPLHIPQEESSQLIWPFWTTLPAHSLLILDFSNLEGFPFGSSPARCFKPWGFCATRLEFIHPDSSHGGRACWFPTSPSPHPVTFLRLSFPAELHTEHSHMITWAHFPGIWPLFVHPEEIIIPKWGYL